MAMSVEWQQRLVALCKINNAKMRILSWRSRNIIMDQTMDEFIHGKVEIAPINIEEKKEKGDKDGHVKYADTSARKIEQIEVVVHKKAWKRSRVM